MMDDAFSLQDSTIAILGLGLMGGSLAMALEGKCRDLVGCDPEPEAVEAACRLRIVREAATNPATILDHADVVILAAPVPAILDILDTIPSWITRPCILIDLGSSKQRIVEAMARLPERFDPVGGHPLCGKEKLSLENAEGALYEGALFLLTPLERTGARAISAARQIAAAAGARPLLMGAAEHDRILAFTSHMPYLLSSALARAVPRECSALVGPGFRSTSRLAGTPSSMMLGVLQSNCQNVLTALHQLQGALAEVELALATEDAPRLERLLNEARASYGELVQ